MNDEKDFLSIITYGIKECTFRNLCVKQLLQQFWL